MNEPEFNENEIFDTNNIEDIPLELKNNLSKCNRFSDETKKLLYLFEIKSTLSIDEMVVGFFRKYKKRKMRSWFIITLSNLSKRKIIKRIEKGTYKFEVH